jgi:hypothetical protein
VLRTNALGYISKQDPNSPMQVLQSNILTQQDDDDDDLKGGGIRDMEQKKDNKRKDEEDENNIKKDFPFCLESEVQGIF